MHAIPRRARRLAPSLSIVALAVVPVSCGGGGGGDFADVPPPQLLIDVPVVRVDGSFLLEGADFPSTEYESAIIHVRDAEGNLTQLGRSNYGGFERLLVAGTYETVYERHAGGSTVPRNEGTPFGAPITWQTDTTGDVDVPTAQVDATFTLNGAAFPAVVYESARIYLRPHAGGELVVLGDTDNGGGQADVLPGVYDIVYSHVAGGSIVPVNQNAVLQADLVIADDVSLPIDVPAVPFLLVPLLDGLAFPFSPASYGRFALRDPAAGDVAVLGETDFGIAVRNVIPGTYDVVFTHVTGGTVPQNSAAVVDTGIVVDLAHPSDTVNVLTALVTPEPSLDGSPFPGGGAGQAALFLHGAGDDTVFFATTDLPPAPVRIVRGTYDVHYVHAFGTGIPLNANARVLDDVSLLADQVLNVPVLSVIVAPSFTHEGDPFPDDVAEAATFCARGATAGDEFVIGLTNAPPQPVRLIQGTYDVFYSHVSGDAIPRNSHSLVAAGVVLAAPQPLPLDVTSTVVAPTFTFDGVEPSSESVYLWAEFFLREPDGDLFVLGDTLHPGAAVRVIPGPYDVVYERRAGSGTEQLPANVRATVDSVVIDD